MGLSEVMFAFAFVPIEFVFILELMFEFMFVFGALETELFAAGAAHPTSEETQAETARTKK